MMSSRTHGPSCLLHFRCTRLDILEQDRNVARLVTRKHRHLESQRIDTDAVAGGQQGARDVRQERGAVESLVRQVHLVESLHRQVGMYMSEITIGNSTYLEVRN